MSTQNVTKKPTTLYAHNETKEDLKQLKIHRRETIEDVIKRLIQNEKARNP